MHLSTAINWDCFTWYMEHCITRNCSSDHNILTATERHCLGFCVYLLIVYLEGRLAVIINSSKKCISAQFFFLAPTQFKNQWGSNDWLPCAHSTSLTSAHCQWIIITAYSCKYFTVRGLNDYFIFAFHLRARMSPESPHKLMGFYMEVLILGVIL